MTAGDEEATVATAHPVTIELLLASPRSRYVGRPADGPVLLRVGRPANPCAWMDHVLAPGAFRAMRGLGGMRCEPLTDGVLRLGPARVELDAADPGDTQSA